ncbi:MAG TPA: BatA domain-containing protein [Lacipirellulaceae bacterium]|nr:BatA domain-containing protein [Lacipirellulaceae bacterium]
MSFLFPALLTIGLPLIAVPLLIHLINLRRQQRIRWAAMQFLMDSQRRNRRWILLKQLLLLATRMAIIAVLVLMLAHMIVRNEWVQLLGRGTTHHLILLDDSYSMSDRWDNTSAFAEAKRAIQAVVDGAYEQTDRQLATILRFSEASQLSAGAQPKVFSVGINDAFRSRLESLLASWEVSQTDVGPADALKAVPRLPLTDEAETLILYIVSDFRARQFTNASAIRKLLSDLKEENEIAQFHLVRCVNEARPNLAITSLVPQSGVRAAGVEMWMSLTATNYGDAPARSVTVQLEQDGDALPAIALDDIAPGDEVSHKFRVQFEGVGAHSLTASLGPDAVDVDNRRYFACNLPAAQPVLIIDGSRDGQGQRQLSLALAPGGNTRTGWQPHVEPASFLADPERLGEQAAVCLLDVPRLADDELAALESYVESGGGAAFFVGPESDRSFYNDRLYRNGEGLFPAPLKLPTQLMDSSEDDAPDVEVTDHALFRVLAGRRNGFLPLILIDYFYAVADDWVPPNNGSTQIIARLRNNEPLVIEKRFGEGRVVAQLSKLSSGDTPQGRWTNWSLNPAFPVLANELVSYLSAGRVKDPNYDVGDDLVVSLEEGKYEPTIRFFLPGDGASGAVGPSRAEVPVDATSTGGQLSAQLEAVAASGIYEAQLQPLDRDVEERQFAVNVPTGEGDLAIMHREEFARQLSGVDFQLHDAADMTLDDQRLAGFRMSDALLGAIVVILLSEQVLAYMASFHAAPIGGPRR